MFHVAIDRDGCISCGTCWLECPDVFEEHPDDARSRVKEPYRSGDTLAEGNVPDDLGDCARGAADACPVAVITVA
jgi:ferredoxin